MKRLFLGVVALSAALGSCRQGEPMPPEGLLTSQPSVGGSTIYVLKTYRPLWMASRETGPDIAISCDDRNAPTVFLSATLAPPSPPPLRGVFATFSGAGYSWSPEMAYLHKSDWLVGRDEDGPGRAGLVQALAAGPVTMEAETGWGLGDTLEWRLPDTPLADEFRRHCAAA